MDRGKVIHCNLCGTRGRQGRPGWHIANRIERVGNEWIMSPDVNLCRVCFDRHPFWHKKIEESS